MKNQTNTKIGEQSQDTNESTTPTQSERKLIAFIAMATSILLLIAGLLGPLAADVIKMYTSPSGIYQVIGQDFVNIIVMVPLLFIGGILTWKNKSKGKYFLIFTPIYLMYFGISYGIGQEWNHEAYSGNSEYYFPFYLLSVISGIILLIYSLSQFTPQDAPQLKKKQRKYYVIIVAIFALLFGLLWLKQIFDVLNTGDLPNQGYTSAPNLFWVIRYLDLGFTIPFGLISLYLFYTRPKQAYPLVLLFMGFFVTMITAVNAMGWVQLFYQDPQLEIASLVIFGIMQILAIYGTYFILRKKPQE